MTALLVINENMLQIKGFDIDEILTLIAGLSEAKGNLLK